MLAWGGLLLLLVAFAHSPLLRTGLFAWDYAHLSGPASWFPSAAWGLVSRGLWGLPGPGAEALPWRLESLAALLLLALLAGALVERCLAPWLGSEPARGGALATVFLVALHPLCALGTAALTNRPELGATVLALAASALFLKGRQEEREGLVIVGLGALVLAGLVSRSALGVVSVITIGELLCVRRHRPLRVRIRTAGTTALVFGSGAILPGLLLGGTLWEEGAGPRSGDLDHLLVDLLLPDPLSSTLAVLFAGVLLLLALRSAFRAARHAPRLWGALLCAWILVLFATAAAGARQGVSPFLAVFWAAGLGIALSPLRAARRSVMIVLLGLGFAVLTHAAGRPWRLGARIQARLCAELRELSPRGDDTLLLLDPPVIEGLPSLGLDLAWMVEPELLAPARGAGREAPAERVRALTSRAFLALASTDVLAAMRARRSTIVVRTLPPGALEARLVPVRLPEEQAPPGATLTFRELAFVPTAPLDPLEWEHATLVAELASSPDEIDRLEWSTEDGGSSVLTGRVRELGGRRVGDFDLASCLDWRLAGMVQRLVVQGGIRGITRGELHARLPELPGIGRPEERAGDWVFAHEGEAPSFPGARLELGLLAMDDLSLQVLPVDAGQRGELRARGAAAFAATHAVGGSPVYWFLDYRVGPQVLQRARGRRP